MISLRSNISSYDSEMNLENLKTKIKSEENVEKIGEYVREFSLKNKEFLEDLIPVLNEKIKSEADVLKISECIRLIALPQNSKNFGITRISDSHYGSHDLAIGILPALKDKLESEKDIGKISKCIITVSHGGHKVAKKLVESFDIKKLKNEIKEEEDIERIGFRVWYLAFGSHEVAENLIPVVKNKIKKEENIEKIVECTRLIALGSEKFAEKLIPAFKDKIEAEEDIGKICGYIERLGEGSKQTAFKLVEQLDSKKAKNPEVRAGIIELEKGGLMI